MNTRTLLLEADKMNDFHSTKELVKNFIVHGHTLKDGTIIRTKDDYMNNIELFNSQHSNSRVNDLIKTATKKSGVTKAYKELSMMYAICFMYPLDVITAIDNLTVEVNEIISKEDNK